MSKLINKNKLTTFTSKLWDKVKARDISSFLYSIDKTNNTKTLKAKRESGTLGDININIDDLASQSLNNTFDGENIFKDIYIKDTVLTYVNNENATATMNGEDQYSGVRELVIPANTYVSSIIIGLSNDLAIGDTVTGINVGTIGTDNVVIEHLIARGTSRVEANSYSVLSSSKIAVVPINRSFDRDIYFMVGARGMVWNNGTGYNAIGGSGMPRPSATVSPNRGNYFGKIAIIGKGASLKERLGNMAKVNEFNSFTSTNNFKKILFEDGYLNTAILSKIDNPRATEPSTGNNIYSASPAFRVQANTFVDKIIIGLGDSIDVGAEVIGVNIGVVGVDNNTVMEHLITRGRATAIANTYNEISCSKIISIPINRTFDKEVYFMVGAKGMVWHQAQFAGVIASGGEDGMPSVGTRLSPNRTNYVGKTLIIGQGLSIQEGFEKAINTYNTVSQATSVGGNNHVGKLVKLSSNGKLDPSMLPVEQNGGVRTVNDRSPDQNGNVTVLAEHIKYTSGNTMNLKAAIDGKPNTVNGQRLNPSNGDIVLTGEHIKYVNGQDRTIKQAIDGKPNTVNGQGQSGGNITIYSDNINISSSDSQKISEALGERAHKNQDNIFTKRNTFNDYSPRVNRVFTRASFRDNLNTSSITAYTDNNAIYFANLSDKYNKPNKPISHLILPIKNARVGDTVSVRCFVFNNNNTILQIQDWFRNYTVEDIDMVGCKCIKIPFAYTPTGSIGFGFAIEHHTRGLGAACVKNSSGVQSWTHRNNPQQNETIRPNSNIAFPYKICYETTSELVTRFELEEVTQMYPKTLIGEYKNISYDAGNTLDDGMNTWLKANGQSVTNTDYPELFEKLNPDRTINDLDNIQVETFELPNETAAAGYYYICAK